MKPPLKNFIPHMEDAAAATDPAATAVAIAVAATMAVAESEICSDHAPVSVFVTGFLQESEHILLVSLYTRLVERIHTEHVAANAARLLEEIDELAE